MRSVRDRRRGPFTLLFFHNTSCRSNVQKRRRDRTEINSLRTALVSLILEVHILFVRGRYVCVRSGVNKHAHIYIPAPNRPQSTSGAVVKLQFFPLQECTLTKLLRVKIYFGRYENESNETTCVRLKITAGGLHFNVSSANS
jgi:hypothetical protein